MAFCISVKETCARSGPPNASAGAFCSSSSTAANSFGKDAVGIQYNQVFSPAAFGAVIARLSGTGVGLGVVTDVQNVLIALCNVLAGNRRTVLYDNDFEILEALPREALQKLVRFVGAVVYGNDNGISHVSVSFYRVTGVDVAKIRFYLVTDGYFAVHSDCYFRFVLFLQSLKVKIICHAPHSLENELCRMRISIHIR